MKLRERVIRSIAARRSVVVLRSELTGFGSSSHLSRVLARLVSEGELVRVSRGIFAKTRVNRFTGRLAPAATFEAIAAEVFRRLEVDIAPGKLAREYNEGKATQIPMVAVVNTGPRRITRKIQMGSRTVTYERSRIDRREKKS